MINKVEATGILLCIGVMALAVFVLRMDGQESLFAAVDGTSQTASVVTTDDEVAVTDSLVDSMNDIGTLTKLVVDDVVVGSGQEAQNGDTVVVNYIGTLQNGTQFDNSYVKGTPFTFTLGKGEVIEGWDKGLLGMKEGGQRIVVIPPSLGYGAQRVGPIPSNSTLVFAVELVEIKK